VAADPRMPRCHARAGEVVETVERTNRPHFTLMGNTRASLAAKEHVNLFLYDGAIVPDPAGLITGGHHNTTARTIAFRQGDVINAGPLVVMLRPDHREQPGWWLAQDQEHASAFGVT